jgi:hypothetical protein
MALPVPLALLTDRVGEELPHSRQVAAALFQHLDELRDLRPSSDLSLRALQRGEPLQRNAELRARRFDRLLALPSLDPNFGGGGAPSRSGSTRRRPSVEAP